MRNSTLLPKEVPWFLTNKNLSFFPTIFLVTHKFQHWVLTKLLFSPTCFYQRWIVNYLKTSILVKFEGPFDQKKKKILLSNTLLSILVAPRILKCHGGDSILVSPLKYVTAYCCVTLFETKPFNGLLVLLFLFYTALFSSVFILYKYLREY